MFQETMFRNLWLGTLFAILFATLIDAAPQRPHRQAGYAPIVTTCPFTPLVRAAVSLSPQEAAYISKRRGPASRALRRWLDNTDAGFDTRRLPTIALANSGGGYRSLLCGAGIVQAFDEKDSDEPTNGLYQALTYHSGLSGGAWLLSSLIGNRGNSTITSLKEKLWDKALAKNSIYPTNTGTAPEGPQIKLDIVAKKAAGFDTSLTDVWSRFLSYQLLSGPDGGVTTRLSHVPNIRNFWSGGMPFPIITALAKTGGISGPVCDPPDDGAQFEFTPYETGSWDKGITAFTPTAYLGTQLERGVPYRRRCVQNFDNLGFVLGTSSSKFQESCGTSDISLIGSFLEPFLPPAAAVSNVTIASNVTIKREVVDPARRNLYANYKNPFYQSKTSPLVANDTELFLVDGGQANQNNPIWPFIQPYRFVDLVFVNDNSADTDDNWPNGTEILHTYEQAKAAGLTKMPTIPSVADFVSKGLNKRATFFGCGDKSKVTIVFLPNQKWTYDSNIPTSKFEYTANETAAVIANGNKIATQGGDKDWPTCLGCAIMHKKSSELPSQCKACLEKYCA